MNLIDLSEQEVIRRNSMEQLRSIGVEPYPAAEYVTNAYSNEIKASFKDDADRRPVQIAGRIMSRRIMGKASFMELQDSEGRIQVYITRDDICPGEDKELYNTVFKKLLDIGDFVGVKGFVFRTQMGEISIHAEELTVLSKSLKPLPVVKVKDGVVFDGFTDPEMRYRQRYVDLIVNEGVKISLLNVRRYSIPCANFSMSVAILKLTLRFCKASQVEQVHDHSSPTIMHWIFLYTYVLQTNYI